MFKRELKKKLIQYNDDGGGGDDDDDKSKLSKQAPELGDQDMESLVSHMINIKLKSDR